MIKLLQCMNFLVFRFLMGFLRHNVLYLLSFQPLQSLGLIYGHRRPQLCLLHFHKRIYQLPGGLHRQWGTKEFASDFLLEIQPVQAGKEQCLLGFLQGSCPQLYAHNQKLGMAAVNHIQPFFYFHDIIINLDIRTNITIIHHTLPGFPDKLLQSLEFFLFPFKTFINILDNLAIPFHGAI